MMLHVHVHNAQSLEGFLCASGERRSIKLGNADGRGADNIGNVRKENPMKFSWAIGCSVLFVAWSISTQSQVLTSGGNALPMQGTDPNIPTAGDMSGPNGTPVCKSPNGGLTTQN